MIQKENKIIADEGKRLIRKQDGFAFGKEIYLGYMHYINNKLVTPPIMATTEMFEEIDEPEEDGSYGRSSSDV